MERSAHVGLMPMPNANTFAPASTPGSTEGRIPSLPPGARVTVVGAGAFGGWSALYLLRNGFRVTLIDAWGAGNSRSSSGDETRVIRSTYGGNEFYFDLNVRALALWKENEKHLGRKFFFNTGVLWFCYTPHASIVDDSIPFAQKHQQDYERLSPAELQRRYPIVHVADLDHAWLDPYGGYLSARESCQSVAELFCHEGGRYIRASVKPGGIRSGRMQPLTLSDGTMIESDAYLFACGSWLGRIFPEVLGDVITCTRQEVYYFGVPQDDAKRYESCPVWVDVDGRDFYYGIPGNAHRGFKIGVDKRGEKFDPGSDDRTPNPQVLSDARHFIDRRFPGLHRAPLIESRVCPYENSPDGNFIFDRHPEAGNVIFLGGGSGHGFKHGPALGELVAQTLSGVRQAPGLLRLFP
jgi:glycine/D-amino acid oxidase-like deaminating enzyme